jgi:hypothetical protein
MQMFNPTHTLGALPERFLEKCGTFVEKLHGTTKNRSNWWRTERRMRRHARNASSNRKTAANG